MRAAVFFIGAEQQPVFFLTQIIRAVRIAQQRQLFIKRGQFGNCFCNQILVGHGDTWYITAKHSPQFSRPITGRIDNNIRLDGAVWCGDFP